jgi:regulator of sirC expression with transglutaminase-like and TPR domain
VSPAAGREDVDPRTAAVARLAAFGAGADAGIDLAEAALLLASLDRPGPALDASRALLTQLVGELARAAGGAGGGLAWRAGLLRRVIAERHGFRGDRESYDDLQNANLISVIERRRGLPVALAIIYIHAARALGWPIEGLNFPGHFLVRLGAADGRAILDPFDGGALRDPATLRDLLRLGAGAAAELAPEHFAALGNREILLRLQNNIRIRLIQADALAPATAILERMLLIAPREPLLWLDAGGHYARLGNLRAAIDAAERCRGLAAEGELRQRAERLLRELKGKLN